MIEYIFISQYIKNTEGLIGSILGAAVAIGLCYLIAKIFLKEDKEEDK